MNPCTTNDCSDIMAFNNLGAQHIQTGDYQTATEYLSAALKLSKQQSNADCLEEYNEVYHHSVTTNIDTWMSQNYCCVSDSIDSSHGEFVYRDPILILSNASASSHDLAIPIVITFNLGLTYYLLGTTMDHTVDRLVLLRSSMRLYQYSFRLQRSLGRASRSPRYFMATINNAGIVYSNLGETRNADQCFQQLLTLLMYMNTKRFASNNNSATVSGYEALFFQNTCRVLNIYQTPCAGTA
jgi:tetratricopeptide (TPR) repeat protein